MDESGTKEPSIQRQGRKNSCSASRNQESRKSEGFSGRTAKLNFHMLDPTTVELAEQRGKLPPGTFELNSDPTLRETVCR